MSLKWKPIIETAATITLSYSVRPTLRQVFYRLVARALIPNSESAYKRLSTLTTEGRRDGTFPPFSDGTRSVRRVRSFKDKSSALRWLADIYREDRTVDQKEQLWVVVEKATLSALAEDVADDLGIPVVALRGYESETLDRQIAREMRADGRPARVFYLGDFDPSGEDIERNFIRHVRAVFPLVAIKRVAVTPAQITGLSLIENPGKSTDSRAKAFAAKHGKLVQVEVEAIDPTVLRRMLVDAIEPHLTREHVDRVIEQEDTVEAELRVLADADEEE
jgi:hypothetical protein